MVAGKLWWFRYSGQFLACAFNIVGLILTKLACSVGIYPAVASSCAYLYCLYYQIIFVSDFVHCRSKYAKHEIKHNKMVKNLQGNMLNVV